MYYLVLAHVDDDSAWRVTRRLEVDGPRGVVRLVSAEELLHARRWSHRVRPGGVGTEVVLPDGTAVPERELGGVFNRLRGVVMPHFEKASTADRQYATMEMFSLLLSWLASLPCPVVNPPTPRGLGGAYRKPVAWLALASQAGLPVPRVRVTSDRRRFTVSGLVPLPVPTAREPFGAGPGWLVSPLSEDRRSALIVGDRLLGDLPPGLDQTCLRLARLAGVSLLRVYFQATSGGNPDAWVVTGADPLPDLPDDRSVDAVVELLTGRRVTQTGG